jgi:hypothetical protein
MPKEGRQATNQPLRNRIVGHHKCQWVRARELAGFCVQPNPQLVMEEVLRVVRICSGNRGMYYSELITASLLRFVYSYRSWRRFNLAGLQHRESLQRSVLKGHRGKWGRACRRPCMFLALSAWKAPPLCQKHFTVR